MAPDGKCALCGGDLDNPSRASVCSRCLLQDAGNLQPDDTHVDADSWVNPEHLSSAVPRAAVEVPGRYTGVREHARGGMGRILIAHDEQLGRDVILKELLGEARNGAAEARPPGRLRESTPVAARFVREARIAGQLEHPSIIPVHELGSRENGDLYYTMKYVQGVSLAESLDRTAGLDERLRLLPHILNVCQAISYAHSRGVIHRDIKPANIMVGEFGETVLIDWGLARVRGAHEEAKGDTSPTNGTIDMGGGGDNGKTAYGQVLGTPAYMAPEQAQGRTDAVDEHSDVYALGALLYTLLTGQPPFSGENRDEVIRRAATGVPEPIDALEPKAPAELVAICTKAMARNSAQRYPSAKALAEELQRFLTGGLVSAHEYRFSEHLRRLVRRNKKAVATAAVSFIIINVLTIGSYVRIFSERNSAIEARNDAVKARDEATQSGEQAEREAYFRAISYAHARIEQGEYGEVPKLLDELPERFRGWEWGYLMGQCRLEEKRVQAHQGPITAFAASRDGSVLATTGEDGNLILWDGHTLTERLRWPNKRGISALALDSEGQTLVAGSEGLLVLDCNTGRVITNSIPPRYDSDKMQEFAMSVNVTGAPEGDNEGCIRFYPLSRELGQSRFQFHNGGQVIRFNLRSAQDPSFAVYSGPIVYYRVCIPRPDARPKNLGMYRDMKVEIDWIAITDDPAFTPDRPSQGKKPNEPAASDLLERAVWTFDEDNEGWAPSLSNGAKVTHAGGKLVLTFEPVANFNPSVRFFPSQEGDPVNAIAFSADGTRLYVLGDRRPATDKQIRVLNTTDWNEQAVIRNAITGKMPNQRAAAMALSPDGNQVVAAATVDTTEGRANYYWGFDTTSYALLWQFHESNFDTHLSVKVMDVAFDPTSLHLLCTGEGWMGLRNLSDGTLEKQWRVYVDLHPGQASKAVWRDPTHFLVGDRQGTVTLYDTETDQTEIVVSSGSNISGLAMHSDDGRVTTADRNGVLKSWLPEAASQLRGAVDLRTADFDWGRSPVFSPDGKVLVVRGFGAEIRAWDMKTFERILLPFPAGESFLGFRPGTDEAALSVDGGRAVRFRRLGDGIVTHEVSLSPELAWNTFAMDGLGKYMAFSFTAAGAPPPPNGPVLIEVSTGRAINAQWPALMCDVRLSEDGRWLAVGRRREGRVDIWSLPECRLQRELNGPVAASWQERGIRSMAFHPSEEVIAAGTGTGKLLLWNYESGNLLLDIQAHEYGETSVCFSCDGGRLATGGDDGYVRIWDWRTGHQILAFQDNYMVRGVAFSSDGSMLASGGAHPPVRMRVAWPRSGEMLPEIQRRRTCHALLLQLDDAKLAWAKANHRQPEDAVVSFPELQPYLAESSAPLTCPSGGTYQLGAVKVLPTCSQHGAPNENPAMM